VYLQFATSGRPSPHNSRAITSGKLYTHIYTHTYICVFAVRNERPPITAEVPRKLADIIELCWHAVPKARPSFGDLKMQFKALSDTVPCDVPSKSSKVEQVSAQVEMCVCACVCGYKYMCIRICKVSFKERWGAGVETQKNVLGVFVGRGRVPLNEPYAPSLSTIYDGA